MVGPLYKAAPVLAHEDKIGGLALSKQTCRDMVLGLIK